jgi:hypothetical protein
MPSFVKSNTIMTREDVINAEVAEWAATFIKDIQDAAATKLRKDTGDGVASFDIDVVKAAGASAAIVVTNFQDHLRYFDMRKVERSSNIDANGMERLKKWIERKGISSFLKGYKYPTEVMRGGSLVSVPATRIINNIAWGISAKRKKLKRAKWYNQQKGSDIYRLYARLVDKVVEHSLTSMAENVTGSNR